MNRYSKVVVKIGSTLLTGGGTGLDRVMIAAWAEQMASMRAQGIDVVLVSSGSIVLLLGGASLPCVFAANT